MFKMRVVIFFVAALFLSAVSGLSEQGSVSAGECDEANDGCDSGLVGAAGAATVGGVNLPIYYSFSRSDEFVRNGELTLTKPSSESGGKLRIKLSDDAKILTVKVDHAFVAAVREDYPMRFKIDLQDKREIMGFIGACDLARSNFQQTFALLLTEKGELYGLSIEGFTRNYEDDSSSVEDCTSKSFRETLSNKIAAQKEVTIKTRARASLPKQLKRIPEGFGGKKYVDPTSAASEGSSELFAEELSKDKKTKGGEESEEEQSFLRKYWYIFLPMFLMSMFGGPQPPDPAQQQAQGAGVQQPAGATPGTSGPRRAQTPKKK